ncbi:cupin domain-containing protein [Synechocystis salina]|uniref:Cupin domain-containing protein n=1 Tax=Synechocystis salina LEGE 00031 TaxID=1828736 RepID=A0ABR9VPH5_9SYNC|nr:cupin domain-containing protein [Synechocystis salina LEGE 00041]MBE9253261.1 cupin domain-containing protein [Synechocystis salina LEGE 00031]
MKIKINLVNKKSFPWIVVISLALFLLIQIIFSSNPVLSQSTKENNKVATGLEAPKIAPIKIEDGTQLANNPMAREMGETQFICEPREVEVYKYKAGTISYCRKKNFPVAENDTARVEIKPGAARTPHWHDTWEEQILISGKAKTVLIDPKGKVFEQNLESGNLVFIPSGWTHWSETVGNETATFIFLFPANFKTFEVLDSMVAINNPLMESILGYDLPKGNTDHDLLIMINKNP